MTKETNILIIGAGPAGLALAGRLVKKGIDFHIIEKSDRIGNSWYHHYDWLLLHTVNQYSHLPYKNFPDDYPTYVSKYQLYDYYQDYTREKGIIPEFKTEIKNISKSGNRWLVKCAGDQAILSNHVILATGANRVPVMPTWKGMESFAGKLIHSSQFYSGATYRQESPGHRNGKHGGQK